MQNVYTNIKLQSLFPTFVSLQGAFFTQTTMLTTVCKLKTELSNYICQ